MLDHFAILADPTRRRLIELLRSGPTPVGSLVDRLPIAQSGVSRHLRVLREAGFVTVERRAQQRIYALRPEPFLALDRWLAGYRGLWEARFDGFADELARRQQTPEDPSP